MYKESDFERVHAYASLSDFSQYDVWGPSTEEDTRKYIKDCMRKFENTPQYEYEFALCLKDTDELIGGCSLRKESALSDVVNIGYAISPDFQSQGYASEAAQALLHFAFNELGALMVYATSDTRNIASYKVMEKIGMQRISEIKKHKMIRGAMRDSYIYLITRSSIV